MNQLLAEKFSQYPKHIAGKLYHLRELILRVAQVTKGVGEIEETLKWGEPSYVTAQTKSGSTIRIDWKEKTPEQYMMFSIARRR